MNSPEHQRIELNGTPIIPGIGIGTVYYYRDLMSREFEVHDIEPYEVEPEIARVEQALEAVREELDGINRSVREQLGEEQAGIFEAQKMMLDGMHILEEFEQRIRRRMINTEYIIRDLFKGWEKKFLMAENEVLQERSKDVADIGSRMLKRLLRIESHVFSELGASCILFAQRLLPSDTVHLDTERVAGIVTAEGGRTSHAAILASALDIPMVSRLSFPDVVHGKDVAAMMDGAAGRVIIHPAAEEVRIFRSEAEDRRRNARRRAEKVEGLPLHIGDEQIIIKATAASRRQIEQAIAVGADGIGLFRIEGLYMQQEQVPEEAWLYDELKACCEAAGDTPLTIRLLDVGGDKELAYLPLEKEANPALGVRGIRYLLHHESLLRAQLRVILRLSEHYVIRLLIPMVTTVDDVTRVREMLEEERKSLELKHASPVVGAMIETPAAVLALDDLLEVVDFVNIGSNDLVQYAMAVDRDSTELEPYYAVGEELVLPWVEQIARRARETGTDCKICGCLAKNLERVPDLIEAGVRIFCVVPSFVPDLKECVLDYLDHSEG